MKPPEPKLDEKKKRWDLRLTEADVVHKVVILILGSIIAAMFLVMQDEQAKKRYYTDLMNARERAETELRAKMFDVLFKAYFENKIKTEKSAAAGGAADVLPELHQETMLVNLLLRNFDNVEIRPLLEDLDERLAHQIGTNPNPGAREREAFRQREALRRVARNAAQRQVETLVGLKKARVSYHTIIACNRNKGSRQMPDDDEDFRNVGMPALPVDVPEFTKVVHVENLRDAAFDLHIFTEPTGDGNDRQGAAEQRSGSDRKGKDQEGKELGAGEIRLPVSFFTMPALENFRLPSDQRVAFSLYKYLSAKQCARFRKELDQGLQIDCDDLRYKGDCTLAQFQAVILEPGYTSPHDRPYATDFAADKFIEVPWWQFWKRNEKNGGAD